MGQYLHLYETAEAFEADYNGEAYHKPWVSLSPRLTVTGLTMEDEFVWSEGATWEYECERDAVDALNGVPGPMGTQHVYEWTWTWEGTPLHAATLVRNPSAGTIIYESGENNPGEWTFNSTNPAHVLTVSGTSSEHLDKVDYNKRDVINSLPLYHGNEYYMDIPLVQEGGVPVFEYSGEELSNEFFDGYEPYFRIKKEFCGNISFEGGGYGYDEDSLHPDCYHFYAANSGWRDTTIRIELDPNSNLEEAKMFDTRFDAD